MLLPVLVQLPLQPSISSNTDANRLTRSMAFSTIEGASGSYHPTLHAALVPSYNPPYTNDLVQKHEAPSANHHQYAATALPCSGSHSLTHNVGLSLYGFGSPGAHVSTLIDCLTSYEASLPLAFPVCLVPALAPQTFAVHPLPALFGRKSVPEVATFSTGTM